MEERILVKLCGDMQFIRLHTVSRREGRSRSLYLTTDELLRLEQTQEVVVHDSSGFAVIRRDGHSETVFLSLYWFTEDCLGDLSGKRQELRLPYAQLHQFLERCIGGYRTQELSLLSMPKARLPKIVFESSQHLRQAVANPIIRRKLASFFRDAFCWRGATEIRLYDDYIPYSFYFQELRGKEEGVSGGVILHGGDYPPSAYYSIHT